MIGKVDNFQNNDNDLVFRSGVKFSYTSAKDYNSQIMEFINYIIELPKSKLTVTKSEDSVKKVKEMELGECFYLEMEYLFKKVYNESKARQIQLFDKKNPLFLSEK